MARSIVFSDSRIFRQDGAPCHTSQTEVDWISENCNLVSEWSANSPERNPIKLFWAILRHSVAALEPTTIAELKEVRSWAWDTIPIATINSLCNRFEACLHLCLEVQGQSIHKSLGPYGQFHACHEWRAGLLQPLAPWTAAADRTISIGSHRIGPKWQKIAIRLPGRIISAVRNRRYTTLSKREEALIYDTEQMFSIRERMPN
jgi:hypothetical protein